MAQPLTTEGITRILKRASSGEQEALSELIPVVYDHLRQLARHYLRRERPGHTLQATALVNEAYLKMMGGAPVDWKDKAHFIGIAARSMRQILIEHARAKNASKRGGELHAVTLQDSMLGSRQDTVDLLALEEALGRLEAEDPKLVRVVELRFFGGLTVAETAQTLQLSPATVKRQWDFARAWLRRELSS